MRLMIKRRDMRELMKALSGVEDKQLEYFKTKIREHLDKLEKYEKSSIKKALMHLEELAKGRGLPVGTIRTWKGKKYVKLANNKWARKYDKEEKGIKQSLTALRKKVDNALTCEELMRIVLLHRDRFTDNNGHPLPIVQELSRYIRKQGDVLEQKEKTSLPKKLKYEHYTDTTKTQTEKKTILEKIRESKPIEISGKEITPNENLKIYKRNALEYGKKLRGFYINKDTSNRIEVARKGIQEILRHDYKNIYHLQSIAAIPKIIEQSIFLSSLPNEDTAVNPDVLSYDYYLAGLKIGGDDYTVKMVVAKDKNGSRYYDHKLTELEKGKLLDLAARVSTTPPSQGYDTLSNYDDKRLFAILSRVLSLDSIGKLSKGMKIMIKHSVMQELMKTLESA